MKKRKGIVLLILWFFSFFIPGVTRSEEDVKYGDINVDVSRFHFTDALLNGTEMRNFKGGNLGSDGSWSPKFYTRADWGADESLRVWKEGSGINKIFRSIPEEAKFLDKKYWPIITTRTNDKGERLIWPIEKNLFIKKIVIHHTGEYIDDDSAIRKDPKSYMRSIYYYHTITRQWGDIGYNFIIDRDGNIYEGRAGGPDTVGAHTAYYNTGTIGISLMGNFMLEEPTEAQLKVLSILVGYMADQYHINPEARSNYLGIEADNITGHRLVTREGRGTSCPGDNMVKRLPELRKNIQIVMDTIQKDRDSIPKGLDFLKKSNSAPDVQKYLPQFTMPNKKPLITLGKIISNRTIIQRSETRDVQIQLQNNSNKSWPAGSELLPVDTPQGMIVTKLRSLQEIPSGKSGVFQGQIMVQKTPNGEYDIKFNPIFAKDQYFASETMPTFLIPIQVSGDKNVKAIIQIKNKQQNPVTPFVAPPITGQGPNARSVKVKLAFFKEKFAQIKSITPIQILDNKDKIIGTVPSETNIKILYGALSKDLILETKGIEQHFQGVSLKTDGVLEITNYNRNIGTIPYNKFRRRLNFYPTPNGTVLVVNELPVEEYLYGLAEEPDPEPLEKKNAIHVLARSYAVVYAGQKRKFNTNLYDLEDDPKTSQFYLGYDWERFHENQKNIVDQTAGQVLTYNDVPVIGPYFTQSDGHTLDIWKKQYPWAHAREVPYDVGLEQKGHGVGLSGHAATALAQEGKNYREIIDYFFDGVVIKKAY